MKKKDTETLPKEEAQDKKEPLGKRGQQRLEGCEDPEADQFEALVSDRDNATKRFRKGSEDVRAANEAMLNLMEKLKKDSVRMPDGRTFTNKKGRKLVVSKVSDDED